MTWSAAEISALAGKAARGAGAPAAQAARFGQVAAHHLMAGRGAEALMDALDALPAGPVIDYALAVDDALIGAGQPPVLWSPAPDDTLMQSYIDALPFWTSTEISETGVQYVTIDLGRPREKHPPKRITACEQLLSRMMALAENTFVPESKASRQAGAGAGLDDND